MKPRKYGITGPLCWNPPVISKGCPRHDVTMTWINGKIWCATDGVFLEWSKFNAPRKDVQYGHMKRRSVTESERNKQNLTWGINLANSLTSGLYDSHLAHDFLACVHFN